MGQTMAAAGNALFPGWGLALGGSETPLQSLQSIHNNLVQRAQAGDAGAQQLLSDPRSLIGGLYNVYLEAQAGNPAPFNAAVQKIKSDYAAHGNSWTGYTWDPKTGVASWNSTPEPGSGSGSGSDGSASVTGVPTIDNLIGTAINTAETNRSISPTAGLPASLNTPQTFSLYPRNTQPDANLSTILTGTKNQLPSTTAGFDKALSDVTPATDYYKTIVGGNQGAIQDMLAPEAGTIIGQYNTAKNAVANLGPRGGGRTSAMAELPFKEAGSYAGLLAGARPAAAAGLTQAANTEAGIASGRSNAVAQNLAQQLSTVQSQADLAKFDQTMQAQMAGLNEQEKNSVRSYLAQQAGINSNWGIAQNSQLAAILSSLLGYQVGQGNIGLGYSQINNQNAQQNAANWANIAAGAGKLLTQPINSAGDTLGGMIMNGLGF